MAAGELKVSISVQVHYCTYMEQQLGSSSFERHPPGGFEGGGVAPKLRVDFVRRNEGPTWRRGTDYHVEST